MATIDEKFEKLIAEKKATEAVAEEASLPKTEVSEDAATGNTAITSGAVPQQKSDLKNDAIEVGGSSKEKPEGPDNVGKKAAAPVGVEKDKTLKMKPSGASNKMPGALSAKIFSETEHEGEVVAEENNEDIAAVLAGADLSEEFQEKAKTVFEAAVDARVTAKIDSLKAVSYTHLTLPTKA